MDVSDFLAPVVGLGILAVRFVVDIAAVVVGLMIWQRWFGGRGLAR